MKIVVRRNYFSEKCTMGSMTLYDKNGVVLMTRRTLEPPSGVREHRCIPRGTYRVVCYPSQKFHRLMPLIDGVPGRNGILIHWGNEPRHTLGCILVGEGIGRDSLVNSKPSFLLLWDFLTEAWRKGEEVEIEVATLLTSP